MPIAPAIACERTAAGVRLDLAGGWTIDFGARLEKEADALVADAEGAHEALIDLSGVEAMDTAGAWVIDRSVQALTARGVATQSSARAPSTRSCSRKPIIVRSRRPSRAAADADLAARRHRRERLRGRVRFVNGVAFLGRLVSVGLTVLVRPPRWR